MIDWCEFRAYFGPQYCAGPRSAQGADLDPRIGRDSQICISKRHAVMMRTCCRLMKNRAELQELDDLGLRSDKPGLSSQAVVELLAGTLFLGKHVSANAMEARHAS